MDNSTGATESDGYDEPSTSSGNPLPVSDAWRRWRQGVYLEDYDQRWDRLEAEGQPVHDEADLVARIGGAVVLDAGCGTGRVAVELARRGHRVVGVDNDADMLAYARRKPEPVRWLLAELSTVALVERFDTVVLAGNILVFVEPGNRSSVVANLARHLRVGGQLIMGTNEAVGCTFDEIDTWCDAAGLVLVASYATWNGDPIVAGGRYRVTVHRLTR